MRLISLSSAALLIAAGLALTTPSASASPGTSQTFNAGLSQNYVVPNGVTAISVIANGAEGGAGKGNGQPGGAGAVVTVPNLPVTAGETLQINVGTKGGEDPVIGPPPGGSNGGGAGGRGGANGGNGGGGGGAADVRRSPYGLADRLVVAGGGGGGAANQAGTGNGGNGGFNGGNGGNGNFGTGGGGGGTTSNGGTAGAGHSGAPGVNNICSPATGSGPPGTAGALGQGGVGGGVSSPGTTCAVGGGGGGGFYGGGGGGANGDGNTLNSPTFTAPGSGGGGAGSSYGPMGTVFQSGRTGDGLITIYAGDTDAPVVTLTSPTAGAQLTTSQPTFSGARGTVTNDQPAITLKIYTGSDTSNLLAQSSPITAGGGDWSYNSFNLNDGTYTAQAEQSDLIGNVGHSDAVTFTIDATPPDTNITSGPKQPKTTKKTATFTFTSTENPSTFECSLDGVAPTSCTSGITVDAPKGTHHFEVAAIDSFGNTDPNPATYDWKVVKKKKR